MLDHAVDFYIKFFGQDERSVVQLDDDFWKESEKVTEEEVHLLEKEISKEEVREAIFGSYAKGAPSPDGFSFLFYQTFWEVIKKDLMNLVNSFERDQLDLDRLNYTMITLIPNGPEAKTLKKFKPISLINCSFKDLE